MGWLAAIARLCVCSAGDAEYQLYLYSGHDTTIMALLRALGLDVDHWPGYLRRARPLFARFESLNSGTYVAGHETADSCYVASVHDIVAAARSNLMFELWERPQHGDAEPRHLVRVLYNRQVLTFPGTAEGAPRLTIAQHNCTAPVCSGKPAQRLFV